MLCVSAANPFLLSRVSVLRHVVGVRRKLGAMLPYITCSFRRSIYKRLGHRKYLLETTDFFALRDLFDLSKGAFAGIPPSIKKSKSVTCCDLANVYKVLSNCLNLTLLIWVGLHEIMGNYATLYLLVISDSLYYSDS